MQMDVDLVSDLESGDFDSGVSPPSGGEGTKLYGSDDVQRIGAEPKRIPADKPEPDAAPSLRDQLTSAFKGEDGKPSTQEASVSADPAIPSPTLTKDSDGRYRQVDGTFASSEQVAAFEAANAAPDTQQNNVLAGMTALEVQQFNALPTELQQYLARSKEALDVRASKYQEYDLLEQVVGPRRQAFAANGTTLPVAINELFALSDFAGRDPSQFIMWFSQQHGIDLDAMLDEYEANNVNVDPTVAALQSQIGQLTNQVNQFTTGHQQQQQQQSIQLVEQIATETAQDGSLVRPYFAELGESILPYVEAIRVQNPAMTQIEVLTRAYDAACWASPTIRTKMQDAADATRRQEQANATQRARNASASITGGPVGDPSSNANNPNRSLREELEYQMNVARQ